MLPTHRPPMRSSRAVEPLARTPRCYSTRWLTLQAKWDLWHALKARGRRPKVRPLRKTA